MFKIKKKKKKQKPYRGMWFFMDLTKTGPLITEVPETLG